MAIDRRESENGAMSLLRYALLWTAVDDHPYTRWYEMQLGANDIPKVNTQFVLTGSSTSKTETALLA
jgi:hypothetical protein